MARARFLLVVALMAFHASVPAAPARATVTDVLGAGATRLPDGHFEVRLADGRALTTHGPDPARNHGSTIGIGDAERHPVCAADYYQHVLYGRPSSAPDRYASVKSAIQASIRRMNAVLNEEAVESGDKQADYKVKCDAAASIQVDQFTAPASDFTSIVNAATAAGFALPNVDYTIFFDAQPQGVCGVGSLVRDERPDASNWNNDGGGYAVAYSSCWNNETPMHENGHNQGAVQYAAPYSTGSGSHCYDENDVMCYSPDGGNMNQSGTTNRCADRIHFDCEHDTYFDVAPESGEYLATKWNLGSAVNRFIQIGSPPKRAPVAAFTILCDALACDFTDHSGHDGTIASWAWDFGDSTTDSRQSPRHAYAGAGTHLVTLTVTDADGSSASTSQTLTVPNSGDPDAATPNLTNGVSKGGRTGPSGSWQHYKIFVPAERERLAVVTDGVSCVVVVCEPALDLFVRRGQRAEADRYECKGPTTTNDKSCVISFPATGYWYVGVRTSSLAGPVAGVVSWTYSVKATY